MNLIKKIEINDPPTKYIINKKRPKLKDGKLITQDTYYLTANLFYSHNLNYQVQRKITDYCKDILMVLSAPIPKLIKCRVVCIYQFPKGGFDLDNKAYFWLKLLFDIMKTPTSKQIINARNKGRKIKTMNVLKDDTVDYIDQFECKYAKGSPKLIFEIYGIRENEQKKLL